MGDRRHAILEQTTYQGAEAPKIFLYVHWDGSRLAVTIRDALSLGRSRWGDAPYLARIIASQVFKAAGIDDLTGAGLGPDYMEGGCADDVRIHLTNNTVTIGEQTWTFAEYVDLTAANLTRKYH